MTYRTIGYRIVLLIKRKKGKYVLYNLLRKETRKVYYTKRSVDKPDGTKGKSFVSKNGDQCLIYWDLDANGWRNATGKRKIKFPSIDLKDYAEIRERLA